MSESWARIARVLPGTVFSYGHAWYRGGNQQLFSPLRRRAAGGYIGFLLLCYAMAKSSKYIWNWSAFVPTADAKSSIRTFVQPDQLMVQSEFG